MKSLTIYETDHFIVTQATDYKVPGYIIVLSKNQYTQLSNFSEEQALDLHRCIASSESVIRKLINPERIYVLKFGEAVQTVHFHIFPRTERIAKAYLKDVDDKKPFSGARIVDWIWSNHNSLNYTQSEILGFVSDARECIQPVAGGDATRWRE